MASALGLVVSCWGGTWFGLMAGCAWSWRARPLLLLLFWVLEDQYASDENWCCCSGLVRLLLLLLLLASLELWLIRLLLEPLVLVSAVALVNLGGVSWNAVVVFCISFGRLVLNGFWAS